MKHLRLFSLLIFILCRNVYSMTPDTVFLEELTWNEVRAAIDSGTTTILVPTAGTEQNGPHIVLGKHNSRMKVGAERIARALGNALVAPVMAYVPEGNIDPPSGHMRRAGTISIPPEVFGSVLEYTARSLKVHGFTDILFIGDSGPNQPVMKQVAEKLNIEWESEEARVLFISEWYACGSRFIEKYLIPRGETPETIGRHAGLTDTALSLAMAPDDVRTSNMSIGKGMDVDGVSGDPTRATVETGQMLYDFMFEATMTQIRELIAE
jgi:creatinine amidohydrolase/Fe(II)-dependent formamide hydrolase-like protein